MRKHCMAFRVCVWVNQKTNQKYLYELYKLETGNDLYKLVSLPTHETEFSLERKELCNFETSDPFTNNEKEKIDCCFHLGL